MQIYRFLLVIFLCAIGCASKEETVSIPSREITEIVEVQIEDLQNACSVKEKIILAKKYLDSDIEEEKKNEIYNILLKDISHPLTKETQRRILAKFILSKTHENSDFRNRIFKAIAHQMEVGYIKDSDRISHGKFLLENSESYKKQTLEFFAKKLSEYSVPQTFKNRYANLILKHDSGFYAQKAKDYYLQHKEKSQFDEFLKNIEKPIHK